MDLTDPLDQLGVGDSPSTRMSLGDLDGAAIGWARSTWSAFAPFSAGGVYVNFSGLRDEADDVCHAVQGASAARLDQIRAEYDPDGIFATAAKVP